MYRTVIALKQDATEGETQGDYSKGLKELRDLLECNNRLKTIGYISV